MRAFLLFPLASLFAATALAQGPAGPPSVPFSAGETPSGRQNQRIERIRHEDAGSRIDEVRYGGQTESITVQPKMEGMPAYEVQPGSLLRERPADPREGHGGQRSWTVRRF